MSQVSDFNYDLPPELIAQCPPERGSARMLVLNRASGTFRDDVFANFAHYVRPGDCLVLNDTRVFPARLHGLRRGTPVEVFLLQSASDDDSEWDALVKPGKRVRPGDEIEFSPELKAEVLSSGDSGQRKLRFQSARPLPELLEEIGKTPLPPYIHREVTAEDRERYQTVFARERGSVAAPTAGLHFTPQMLDRCREAGAEIAYVTLHVGLGTFAPVRADQVADIRLHSERFRVPAEAAAKLAGAQRVLCVGTTSVRTVETVMIGGAMRPLAGETNLFIHPGFTFRATGAMLTNFHLPKSTLLMLVCAFAGQQLALAAYRHAVSARYRFFSYGDCMLIE